MSGPMTVEHARQMPCQRRQVFVVAGAVVERDVEIAGFLPEREVVRAVHREREHRRLVAENCRGAVALMDIAIDHRGACDGAVAQQHGGSDRDVVEDAVALAAIAEGVVCAAGEVRRDARLKPSRSSVVVRSVRLQPDREDVARRGQRRPNRSSRPLDHHRRPREADPALRLGGQGAGADRVDVAGVVDQPHVVPRDRFGNLQIGRGQNSLRDEPFAEQAVLRHRKSMVVGQRQDEGVGVERFHGRGRCYSFIAC